MRNMKWMNFLCAALLLAGCEAARENARRQAEQDAFPPEDDTRSYRRFATAQEAAGARHDGMLYVTSGDGTSDSDMNLAGQDLSKLLSKVLRIDVDHPDAGRPYGVPKDNPFVGKPGARQ